MRTRLSALLAFPIALALRLALQQRGPEYLHPRDGRPAPDVESPRVLCEPSCRKGRSRATALVILSRRIRTKLVRSVRMPSGRPGSRTTAKAVTRRTRRECPFTIRLMPRTAYRVRARGQRWSPPARAW
jgi:hypothetical protein